LARNGRGSGARDLAVRVKSARNRNPSSTRWLQRQLNDPYVARARREGYRSRSAYKLIEIDDRFHILAAGRRVVDLGAAPGGWSQVAAGRLRSPADQPALVAVDILPMDPIAGVSILTLDFLSDSAPSAIRSALRDVPPDVIMSDMAASTVGHRRTDALRTELLYEAAATYALESLAPGGHFLTKIFKGGAESRLLAELKRHFGAVSHVKPRASRPESVELYLLARDFKGR
jgi:23S rRNA (uridine2552-2'-O)-methyltransferase